MKPFEHKRAIESEFNRYAGQAAAFGSAIAKVAKSRGYTQASLAVAVGVSVPTMKRWLRGQGLALDQLMKVLTVLDITFAEVEATSGASVPARFRYTLEQEEFFAEQPLCLAVFDQLIQGTDIDSLIRRHPLTPRRWVSILRDLEALKLIERLPADRYGRKKVRLKVSGEPVWRSDGPLAKSFRQSLLNEMIEKHATRLRLYLHTYLPQDERRILGMIDDLIETARAAEHRARAIRQTKQRKQADALTQSLLVIGLMPFSASFLQIK